MNEDDEKEVRRKLFDHCETVSALVW